MGEGGGVVCADLRSRIFNHLASVKASEQLVR